jgi:hypothetical protein
VPLDGPVLAVGEGLETCLAFHKLLGPANLVVPLQRPAGALPAAPRGRALGGPRRPRRRRHEGR